MNEKWETHESYGLASFTRTNGFNDYLFGCGTKCNNTIRLEIKKGSVQRTLSDKWYHEDDLICEVEFSPAQFVELLTSMNMGPGVPCTILFADGTQKEKCPKQDDLEKEKEHFRGDLHAQFKMAFDLLKECADTLGQDKIGKKDAAAIKMKLGVIKEQITSNMPFVAECFEEMMERKITEGKAEIDASVATMIHRLGMEKLGEKVQSQLLNTKNPEIEDLSVNYE